ncbi:tRNA 2-selenouridine(34) synthase MnmH [Flavisolibacter sp. BT320]|nr:tRNA 2-selenouridine(34) synthase MnmH [Flavisolibacter longurius]
MRRVAINEFLAGCKNALVIDVRSPAEYNHAHLPGAVNLPLFSDEERAVVGTKYKQVSRQAAIKIGLDYFGPKMRLMVEEVEKSVGSRQSAVSSDKADTPTADCLLPTANSVYLYCWRGGMRSGAVAWLLNLYGFEVTVLAGGYKAFRHWVLQTNAYPYRLKLVGGYTGSGKTALLKALAQKGELIVDLEALAKHKGSAFGNIGMPPQPSQEMFENNLAWTIAERHQQANAFLAEGSDDKAIWLEDESQRIGHVNIPQPFWKNMRQSPVYFLDIPFEERLQNIVADYGNLDRERMIAAIQRIGKRLGPLETKTAIQFLQDGSMEECFRILLHYYDKQYRKGLHNREDLSSLLTNITCEKVCVSNAALLSQVQPLSK